MKKRLLLFVLALAPVAMFANSDGSETDIIQRTINFIIFAAILWYLIADKIKDFFANRTTSIQAQLDKVEDTLKASEEKVDNARKQLEEAKVLANEILDSAKADIDSIKQKVAQAVEIEVVHLERNFNEKIRVETLKTKKEIVCEVLEELLSSNKISLSEDELANIILKKVA